MKKDKLYNAITNIDQVHIESAANYRFEKPGFGRRWAMAAVAACLVLSISLGIMLWPDNTFLPFYPKDDQPSFSAYALSLSQHPETVPFPSPEDYAVYNDYLEAHEKWYDHNKDTICNYPLDHRTIESFYSKTIPCFLSNSEAENPVYSPLNLYMALAMLAETSDGNSRQQLLDLLGEKDIVSLRSKAKALWNRSYADDGAVKTILASSVWLNKNLSFNQSTLDSLSENYYADSFSGDATDKNYSLAFQQWINQQTDNQLSQGNGFTFDENMIMTLATTVNFSAKWTSEFEKNDTKPAVFHAKGSTVTCDFMNQQIFGSYYFGEKFSAVAKSFSNAGQMLFILPDEGYTTQDVLEDRNAMELMLNSLSAYSSTAYTNAGYSKINLSVPKFDITSETDLTQGLKALGVKDIFDDDLADFSPLTDETAFVSEAKHNVRVTIDEQGCKAAAYTAMALNGSALPKDEVDFVLNRPFIFVITSDGSAPLFVGVVNNPS